MSHFSFRNFILSTKLLLNVSPTKRQWLHVTRLWWHVGHQEVRGSMRPTYNREGTRRAYLGWDHGGGRHPMAKWMAQLATWLGELWCRWGRWLRVVLQTSLAAHAHGGLENLLVPHEKGKNFSLRWGPWQLAKTLIKILPCSST